MSQPLAFYSWLRTFRLLEPGLCGFDTASQPKESRWLWQAAKGKAGIEETSVGQRLVAQLLAIDTHPLDGLFQLADALVTFGDGRPRCTDQDTWQSLNLHIDIDLIIAARLGRDFLPQHAPRLEASLAWPSVLAVESFCDNLVQSQELIDTHVHLSTALPLTFYWVALMAEFAPVGHILTSVPNHAAWEDALLDAVAIRRRLARWLTGRDPDQLVPHLLDWDDDPFDEDDPVAEPFADCLLVHLFPHRRTRLAQNPVLGERLLLWFLLAVHIRDQYDAPNVGAGRTQLDPCPETLRKDVLRYLRIRNSFIRELTYRPLETGLDYFRQFFKIPRAMTETRTSRANRERVGRRRRAFLAFERFRMRHALRYQFSDPTDAPWARDHGFGLNREDFAQTTPWRPPRQVELRISSTNSSLQKRHLHALLMGYRDFLEHDLDAPLLRLGLIFHTHKRPFYKDMPDKQSHELEGILSILEEEPDLRPFVVGLDACSSERDLSPRHLRAFFGLRPPQTDSPPPGLGRLSPTNGDFFHGASRWDWLAQRIARSAGMVPIRLRRTCHAGEDFHDLLSGLRWMDDSVVMLNLRPGERLGHGIALAWLPREWYRDGHRHVTKPRGDHLVDLLWARRLLSETLPRLKWTPDLDLLNKLDYLLRALLSTCDLAAPNLDQSLQTCTDQYYDALSDQALLTPLFQARAQWHPADPKSAGNGKPKRAADLLGELISVTVNDDYIALVEACRARVRTRIVAGDIVLELCPTSNRYIGGFARYADLPYTNLNQYGLAGGEQLAEPVLVSINTDNPGLFRTTIAHEYRLLGEGLRARGHGPREVARWLEEARQAALASAFIPPWSPPSKPEMRARLDRLSGKGPR
ncbi:hypothetical protein [Acanthopleuribacter pedis]|uniref:adenosine deaminase n=1 Tax=Acanthopleuribacter pedis TaxID=442870 RepID=A0A8J7U351_9BACT|nr:hypothetical protein [Acanthopleuribacter pedis]MBO1319262.1 hypothetical protein [Acanthopleuribacter pedis]